MGLLDMLNPFQKDEVVAIKPGNKSKGVDPEVVRQRVYTPTGSVDPKITSHFEKLMEDANIPGPDYFEYKKALKKMVNVPEQMAFTSTFTAFETMGVTKEKLISSIETYIEVVKSDSTSFKASVDKKTQTDITTKEAQIVNNNTKITALQQQMADLQSENIKLNSEAQINKQSIGNTQSAYEMTAQMVISELESDKTKINQYLT